LHRYRGDGSGGSAHVRSRMTAANRAQILAVRKLSIGVPVA
jgi:hypothetical protein